MKRAKRRSFGALCPALLAGTIFGASARHVLHALVGLPPWLELLTALSISTAAFRSAKKAAAAALAGGAILAFTLPSELPPPNSAVVTHAATWTRGIDLFDALAKLDEDPDALAGKRITVSGLWRPAAVNMPAAVYRVVMACCAADAVDVGFDVLPAHRIRIAAGSYVSVSGLPEVLLRSGETRLQLKDADVSAKSNGAR